MIAITPSADRGLIRRPGAEQNSQVFVVCGLAAACLAAAFFFCLGFLASRLDRFCSLFATTLSRHANRRRICCGFAPIQPLNFPPASERRFGHRLLSPAASAEEVISFSRLLGSGLGQMGACRCLMGAAGLQYRKIAEQWAGQLQPDPAPLDRAASNQEGGILARLDGLEFRSEAGVSRRDRRQQ